MIKIKVGLIPPRGLENFALASNFHLALAMSNLMARKTYGGMYARASRLGDFVVLDNGAAEGAAVSDYELLDHASFIQASELVAPDVIRDSTLTLKRTKGFINGGEPRYRLMAVPQGITLREFQKCVDAFAAHESIKTIGIPRHMLTTLGSKSVRIDFANWIKDEYDKRFSIHLLGTDPSWVNEVKHAAKYASHIRSVDTSLPFNYALQGVELKTTDRVISRPGMYFTKDWSGYVSPKLVRLNVETLLEWAGAPELVKPKANVA